MINSTVNKTNRGWVFTIFHIKMINSTVKNIQELIIQNLLSVTFPAFDLDRVVIWLS